MLKDNTNQNDIQAQGRLKKRDHGKLYQGDGGSATDDFPILIIHSASADASADKSAAKYLEMSAI